MTKFSLNILFFIMPILLVTNLVVYTPNVFSADNYGYVANKEGIKSFFESTMTFTGKPVIVSKQAAKKQISGNFNLSDPYAMLDSLSKQMGLLWYSDGKAIYIYDASEMRNSLISLRNVNLRELNEFLKQSGLYDEKYTIKGGNNGTFYVSGPPIYVELVVNASKLMDQNSDGIEIGRQKIGIIHLINTFVSDRTYELRGEKIVIPGLAKVVASLLTNEVKQQTKVNVVTDLASNQQMRTGTIPKMPAFPLADEETNELKLENITTSGAASLTDDIKIIAYPGSNSLLVKGSVAQVDFVEKLVTALDIPKRHIELSLWIIDLDKSDLEQMGTDWSGSMTIGSRVGISFNQSNSISTLDGSRFIAAVQALEQKKRASVVSRPVVLTQENIPAIFDNNHTFYTKLVGERTANLEEVTYGTMISVLPRFGRGNQIELLLNIEDGNESDLSNDTVDSLPKVGRTLISTVARVPQGKSLLVGGYTRDSNTMESKKIPLLGSIPLIGGLFRYEGSNSSNIVRVFLIQPREIDESQMHDTNSVMDDAKNLTASVMNKKDINDELLQKWVHTYLNREVGGIRNDN
uniref:type III secretion system outer membrane ring subunit SctC n=1 Tax=Yersinia frederiksenii TaxID=29484 RepID=UPI001F4C0C63|nr:type III secretion system outer membrane ring subunit SctC [Yersinia frederiksenii]ULG19763.1 EscC/YscC/HrcC family type III secretion system outer membrane ring protein [Yersinia frederiksenii]